MSEIFIDVKDANNQLATNPDRKLHTLSQRVEFPQPLKITPASASQATSGNHVCNSSHGKGSREEERYQIQEREETKNTNQRTNNDNGNNITLDKPEIDNH